MSTTRRTRPKAVSSPHVVGLMHTEDERLVQSFVLTLEVENKAKTSIVLYRHAIVTMAHHLRGAMGVTAPLNEVTTEHLREFVGYLVRERAAATANTYLAVMKSFFKWLVAEGERRDDPSERIKRPTVPMTQTDILNTADIKALLAACTRDKSKLGLRDAAIILLMLDTGLRANELCSATVGDLDLDDRVISVVGKGRKPRTVGISARTCVAIDRYLRKARPRSQETEPLFAGRTGKRLGNSGLQALIQSRATEAGLKDHVWPHRLRHTAATLLADAGLQEGELRHIMGWSPASQMVYRYTSSTLARRARESQARAGVLDTLLG